MDKELFLQYLLLTQIHCENEIQNQSKSIARILRTLHSKKGEKKAFDFTINKEYKLELTNWNYDISDNNYQLILELFKNQMFEKRQQKIVLDKKQFQGNIFVSEFESTFCDGVSEIESKGLIDYNDLPPIDTWFYLLRINNISHVFSWIPQKFYEEANAAIQVNCLDVLSWLKNWGSDIYNFYEKEQ